MALTKITSTNIGSNAVANSIGYTPANKAGDTFTGNIAINGNTNIVISSNSGSILSDASVYGLTIRNSNTSSNGTAIGISLGHGADSYTNYIGSVLTGDVNSSGKGDLVFGGRPSDASTFVERMRIDSAGRVTRPYQPAFRAMPNNSVGTFNTSTNSLQLMSNRFDTLNNGGYNIGSHYNLSTGIFTAPVAGYYFTFAGVRWETGNFVQNSYIRIFISLNDGDYNSAGCMAINGNNEAWANYMNMNISGVVYMSANDTLRLKGGMDGGTTTVFHSESYFGAYLMG